ncbi:DUF4870 domain-containing protein [Candidatus Omnitrophota bacterium]
MEEEKKVVQGPAVSGENAYAILSYLWVLCLIPFLLKKENRFVSFHARQGLMLFIVEVGVGIVGIIPGIGSFISMIGILVCGILSLIGIVQVLMGKEWKIPVIGDWAKNIKV